MFNHHKQQLLNKEVKVFTAFVSHFFRLKIFFDDGLKKVIEDDVKEIIEDTSIKEEYIEVEYCNKNNNNNLHDKLFNILPNNYKDTLKGILLNKNVEYNHIQNIKYSKLVFLNWLYMNNRKIYEYIISKKINYTIHLENLYDIYYFHIRGYKNIIEDHLLKCECSKYSKKHDRLFTNTSIYKYVQIFRDVYHLYKSNSKSLNKLIEIFYRISLTYSNDKDLYIYLPIYLLYDIFGVVILDPLIDVKCYYSLFYKYLINYKYSSVNRYFIDSRYPKDINYSVNTISQDSKHPLSQNIGGNDNNQPIIILKNISDHSLIKKYLLYYYNENKGDAIKEILFENNEKYMRRWVNDTCIFGVLYFNRNKPVGLLGGGEYYFLYQSDYIQSINEEDNTIIFYDFEKEIYTKVKVDEDIIRESNSFRIYYIQNYTNNKVYLTKNCMKKIEKYFEKEIEEVTNIEYKINLVIDSVKMIGSVFKNILSKVNVEEFFDIDGYEGGLSDVEKDMIKNIPVFEGESVEYCIYNTSLVFGEMLMDINGKSDIINKDIYDSYKEIIINMCNFFMKKIGKEK